MATLTDDGERLAALVEQEVAPPQRIKAVVSATAYIIALPKEDTEVLQQKGRWEHLEGVLYRRRCHSVNHDPDEGLLTFSIGVGEANIDDVVSAIVEELDEITGRKMEEAGGETWGMF